MFAATSARQQVLSSAASSQVSGGTRRVLTVPATDAFAMIATAQTPYDMVAAPTGRTGPSGAAEAIVAGILPEAARIIVGNAQRYDEFRVLEAQLCRNPDLHRVAEFTGEYLVSESKGHDRLGVERRRHVDACVIAVGTDKTDMFGGEIGPDPLEKDAQRTTAPLADAAPPLDADMPGDLRGSRQLIKLVHGPRPLVPDLSVQLQLVAIHIEKDLLVLWLERVL